MHQFEVPQLGHHPRNAINSVSDVLQVLVCVLPEDLNGTTSPDCDRKVKQDIEQIVPRKPAGNRGPVILR
jgi:hypothetical protein